MSVDHGEPRHNPIEGGQVAPGIVSTPLPRDFLSYRDAQLQKAATAELALNDTRANEYITARKTGNKPWPLSQGEAPTDEMFRNLSDAQQALVLKKSALERDSRALSEVRRTLDPQEEANNYINSYRNTFGLPLTGKYETSNAFLALSPQAQELVRKIARQERSAQQPPRNASESQPQADKEAAEAYIRAFVHTFHTLPTEKDYNREAFVKLSAKAQELVRKAVQEMREEGSISTVRG